MGLLLTIYAACVLIVLGIGLAGIYHARRFGLPGDKTRLGLTLYLILVIVILVISVVLLAGTNTTEAV